MSNILIILFVILDCKVWRIDQVAAWADELISKLDSPKSWLLDLSIGNSVDTCLETVREAMREFGVSLPEDIGGLMAGLILLRYDSGELSEEMARSLFLDIVDAYETNGVDAESVQTLRLDSGVCLNFRHNAEQVLKYLHSGLFLISERKLISD